MTCQLLTDVLQVSWMAASPALVRRQGPPSRHVAGRGADSRSCAASDPALLHVCSVEYAATATAGRGATSCCSRPHAEPHDGARARRSSASRRRGRRPVCLRRPPRHGAATALLLQTCGRAVRTVGRHRRSVPLAERRRRVAADARPAVLAGEQSNTSLVYGDSAILKVFRRVAARPQPRPRDDAARWPSGSAGTSRARSAGS